MFSFANCFWYGVETLTDMWLVFVGSILYHIVAILLQDGLIDLSDLVHVIGSEESIDSVRQSSDSDIYQRIFSNEYYML